MLSLGSLRKLAMMGTALVLSCNSQEKDAPATPNAGPAADAEPLVVAADSPCSTDADCRGCTTAECGCAPQLQSVACPTGVPGCFIDPCGWRAAQCVDERCTLLPAAGPCAQDSDCTTRRHPSRCEFIAALTSAPTTPPARGCGGMTAVPKATCQFESNRCVLAP